MPKKHAIFIAATGQNVGKTTLCLGIIAGLRKRYTDVGFIKPVGQQHVKVDEHTNVDKDVVLFKEHFKLPSSWEDMSPIIIPSGYTRDFLDGKVSENQLNQKINTSFHKIFLQNDYTIVEGTGHIGVGSIVNMNNARVAAELGLDMVMIASGGLGSACDELALNFSLCQQYGVKVRGVILNRVLDDKRDMIKEYFPKTLKKWNIPLIGCVPYNEFLDTPCMKDFELLFETKLLAGEKHGYRHFQHSRLVAGALESYEEERVPNQLIITPACREDIIRATLKQSKESVHSGGMILTGKKPPSPTILKEIRQHTMPVLYAPLCSYDAMKMITSFTAKIRTKDLLKIEKAIKIVEENINFDQLCNSEKL
jgi:phosphate acetyltransferase